MSLSPPVPEVRDLRFQLDGVERYWHGGRRSVSLFFDNLSVFFPAGERFFVASVKAYAPEVTQPRLKAELEAFCAQEGHHSREHVRYNKLTAAQGLPIVEMEGRVQRLLDRVWRRTSKLRRLAVTCALEHFTALLASLVLEDPRTLEGAEPRMAALWRWHAAEEHEHKAVAFDVYRAVGGPWWLRCGVMWATTLIFWAKIYAHQARLMAADGILWSFAEWRALLRFLWIEPGGFGRLLLPYLRYYRPSFHPWESDTTGLVERWKAEQHRT